MEIDLVYLWVDGNDPEWLAKKNKFTGIEFTQNQTNCKGRYANNNELKYSLRSVEKYLPWIRKIFIVTDNQTPDWIDTSHPKIEIIDHKDILPPEALPCFNSLVIEYFLFKIPNLSEHFLYANDDMFVAAHLSPEFFFSEDGYPVVRLKRAWGWKWGYHLRVLLGIKIKNYRKKLYMSMCVAKEKLGKSYTSIPHHNIDTYIRSDYQCAVQEIFKKQIDNSLPHRVRSDSDLQRSAFSYYMLAIGHGHLKHVKKRESCRIGVQRPDYMKYINRYQPKLFCLNDSQRVTEEDRERIVPFLESLFPTKSAFEK